MIGKKIPSQSNDKFVNYSQQRIIFHWNWKEILRFVGFITWLTQPIQPKLVEISVGVPPALQQTSIFLFSFNEKWLYGDYILWIYFQNCWEFFSLSIQARGSCDVGTKSFTMPCSLLYVFTVLTILWYTILYYRTKNT